MKKAILIGSLFCLVSCGAAVNESANPAVESQAALSPSVDTAAGEAEAQTSRSSEDRLAQSQPLGSALIPRQSSESGNDANTGGEVPPASGPGSTPEQDAAALRELRLNYTGNLETANSVGPMSSANPSVRLRSVPVAGEPGLFDVTLNNTGSGYEERFLLQVPLVSTSTPAPMLVVFHKFGVSHWDAYYNTSFITEARNRGWYLVAPLGASGVSFGSIESQVNTRAAIEIVTELYNVDKTRVYGVGFSMGGGNVVSYAARNLDPERIMFAAICDHTGGVSLTHTYYTETDDGDVDDNNPEFGANLEVRDILDYWFEGPPWAYTFNYLRVSAFDLSPWTGQIDPTTDMARNLAHVPTLSWLADGDPSLVLFTQTAKLANHIEDMNQANALHLVPSSAHTWHTLDEVQVCDYLSKFTLELPASGRTLADENGRFFHFGIEQDEAYRFTPFTWNVDTDQNSVDLTETENLKRISVDCESAGLHVMQPIKLRVSANDGLGDEVLLVGVPNPPSSVLRDGVAAASIYNASSRTLHLTEFDAEQHEWVVTP
jgi:pimeloyl-ACP methyl ester carboxylesterase